MSNFCTLSQATPNEQDPFKIPAYPEYPKLRLGTQLDAIYERLYRDGYGIRKPGISDVLPKVLVVFDPRCSWSNHFWQTSQLLTQQIDFIWFPVCVSSDYSTAQAAAMLASENSWDVLREHEELFSDPDYCGIHPEAFRFTQADRDHVWENARIFRKAGGTSVPLGIFKTQDGRYIPLFGDNTASEIRSKIELS